MKSVILYAYPQEPDGLSLQGQMLFDGMKENGENVMPCNLSSEFQKEWLYEYYKPDVAIGVGYWGHSPDIVFHPRKFGVTPVPWFVADGWVANYHNELSSLPLVLTTSTWVTNTYARDGVDTTNFVKVPIGFDLDVFKPIQKTDERIRAIRRKLGVADNELMLLTAGGDVTSKGAQEVLKALAEVDKEVKNWKYILKVWGGSSADDHYDDEMKLIDGLGDSKDKVKYIEGSLSPDFMPLLLNSCDIYLAPSRLEGFGMIQVEAQACGIPVISINEMGPKETVVHNKTGFLADVESTVILNEEWVHTGVGFDERKKIVFEKPKIFAYRANVGQISEYLLKLLTNENLRIEMGKFARKHVEESFEYHSIAQYITKLIKEHLNFS
jgi:alpha-maltose-1-phosphate synthase